MTFRRLFGALGLAVMLVSSGCTKTSTHHVVLDGRPRSPDVEGVVKDVSLTRIVLDSGRRYRITRDLQCFSTVTLQSVSLLERKGQYVQLGLDGDRVAWLALIGGVLEGPKPAVYYRGVVVRTTSTTVVFRDGTVLRLGGASPAGLTGQRVLATIDPAKHAVTALATS